MFQVTKGKDLYPRLLYPAKLSLRVEGQIICFPDKVKLKEFINTKPLLNEMLKGLKKKKIKTMNSKMTISSQLSTAEPKKQKQTKQTIRTGTKSHRSHGGLSAGR